MKEQLEQLRAEAERAFLYWNPQDKKIVGVSQIADSYRNLMLACNSALHALELEPSAIAAITVASAALESAPVPSPTSV